MRSGIFLAIGVVLLLFSGLVAGRQTSSRQFKGTIRIVYSDNFTTGESSTSALLELDNGVELKLKPSFGQTIPLARNVTITGKLRGSTLRVESISVEDSSPSLKSVNSGKPSLGPQRRLVMMYNFQDNPTNKPWTKTLVNDLFFNQVNKFYSDESYGKTTLTGEITDWITIPVDSTDCTTPVRSLVEDGARAQGFNPDAYTDKVFLLPAGGCHSAGGATFVSIDSLGNYTSLISICGQGNSFYTLAHEYGHSLGFAHANSLSCPAGVTIDDSCTTVGYGDNYDVMGYWNNFYSGAEHRSWGWWTEEGIDQLTVTTGGVFTLVPIESSQPGLKVIRIPKQYGITVCNQSTGVCTVYPQDGYYYIEYKQPIGNDSSLPLTITSGALFHVMAKNVSSSYPEYTEDSFGSFILDVDKLSSNIALAPGNRYADANLPLTVTTLSADSNSCVVSIEFTYNPPPPDTTAPTITITSPSDGSRIPRSGQVSVYASVSDNVGVVRVELYVDGVLKQSTTTPPFNTKWSAKNASNGAHTIFERAYDAAGNIGQSQTITIYK